jgi:hypothetical protein
MIETKYVLDYLREEMYIEPVAGTVISLEEEEVESCTPIGYRLVLNGKETDIVVWYADLNSWLIKKYEELKSQSNE